jgi:hypothetical protein
LGATGLSDEEQALFEELEREAENEKGGPTTTQVKLETTETPEEREEERQQERARQPIAEEEQPENSSTPKRREPEPG